MKNPSREQEAGMKIIERYLSGIKNYYRYEGDWKSWEEAAKYYKKSAEETAERYGIPRRFIFDLARGVFDELQDSNLPSRAIFIAELFKLDDTYSDSPEYGHMTDEEIQKEIDDLQKELEERRRKYPAGEE